MLKTIDIDKYPKIDNIKSLDKSYIIQMIKLLQKL